MANNLTGTNLRLTWNDFAAQPPQNPGDDAALTDTTFTYGYKTQQAYAAIGLKVPEASNDLGWRAVEVKVSVTLNRHKMWVVPSAKSDALLAHEQGHYEITALVMQDFYTDILSPPNVLKSAAEVQTYVEGLAKEATRRINKMQSNNVDGLYDVQTKHGLDASEQSKWNRAFANARPPVGMRFDLSLDAAGITV